MATQEGSVPGSHTTVGTRTGQLEERGRDLGRKTDTLGARVQKSHEIGDRPGLRERFSAARHRVATRVHDGRARVEHEVQAHPVRTVLWAASFGMVVGLLLGRRSKR
jgi:ElaB/YqjD/DUF883 family membrane-anchored ribosome-binding protein